MKILVIEDKDKHQQSAKGTLKGHDVTALDSFEKAMERLSTRYDEEQIKQLADEKAGFKFSKEDEWEKQRLWWDARDEVRPDCIIPFEFDVVLTDMMMPMSRQTLGQGVFKYGQQVPYGFIIALKAALAGAKFIAMVTDTNHHQGAMSAALDHLGQSYYRNGFKPNFEINGAKVMFVHSPFVHVPIGKKPCTWCKGGKSCDFCKGTGERDVDGESKPCNSCKGSKICSSCKGSGEADDLEERKDWGTVLRDLLEQPHPKKEEDEDD